MPYMLNMQPADPGEFTLAKNKSHAIDHLNMTMLDSVVHRLYNSCAYILCFIRTQLVKARYIGSCKQTLLLSLELLLQPADSVW